MTVQLESLLTCPACGHAELLTTPTETVYFSLIKLTAPSAPN